MRLFYVHVLHGDFQLRLHSIYFRMVNKKDFQKNKMKKSKSHNYFGRHEYFIKNYLAINLIDCDLCNAFFV